MLIGELARLVQMSKDGIRHYEKLGLIRSTERRAGSRMYRDYDACAIRTIEHIRQAQLLGLSLIEIGPILEAYDENGATHDETVAFLSERLNIVRGKMASLQTIETFIVRKLERYGVPSP